MTNSDYIKTEPPPARGSFPLVRGRREDPCFCEDDMKCHFLLPAQKVTKNASSSTVLCQRCCVYAPVPSTLPPTHRGTRSCCLCLVSMSHDVCFVSDRVADIMLLFFDVALAVWWFFWFPFGKRGCHEVTGDFVCCMIMSLFATSTEPPPARGSFPLVRGRREDPCWREDDKHEDGVIM
jgi:hypothetical protein